MPKTLISKFSPHLDIVSSQTFQAEELLTLGAALEVAMENGGGSELDFERVEGVSYNPRPARVALILIKDAGIQNMPVIAAALLASLDAKAFHAANLERSFDEKIVTLASRSYENILDLSRENTESSKNAVLIAAAHWLDRVRHLHQSPKIELRHPMHEATKPYIEYVLAINPRLSELLDAWYKRFERILL